MTKELIVSANSHESTVALIEDDQLVEVTIARGAQHGLAGSIYKGRVTRVLPGMQSAFVNIGLERDAFLYVSDFVGEMEELEEDAADSGAVKAVEKSTGKAIEVAPPSDVDAEEDETRAGEDDGAEDGQPEAPEQRTEEADGNRAIREDDEAGDDEQPRAVGTREAEPSRDRRDADGRDGDRRDRDGNQGRDGRRGRGRRSRRRRGRGGRFPDSKYARVEESPETSRDSSRARRPDREPPREASEPEEDHEFTVLPGESLAKYSGGATRSTDSSEGDGEEFSANGRDDSPEDNELFARPDPRAGTEDESEAEDTGDDSDDASGEHLGHRRGRVEFEQAMADDDEEDSTSVEGASENAPEGDSAVAVEQESSDSGEDDQDDPDSDPDSERQAVSEETQDEADNGDSDSDEMALDDSEAEQVREAIASMGEDDESDEEASSDDESSSDDEEDEEEDERDIDGNRAVAASSGSDGGGAREARVRGRGGSSRYLQRRGGRRGRRRGRGRGPRQAEETAVAAVPADSSRTSITDLLSAGQEILVQISKEPLGKKGARITSHIAMPGRYLVYMPTVEHVGVSRKIGSDNERMRLRKIVQSHRTGMPGGFIVRTAGAGASEEEIRGDMLFLYNLWLDIRQKAEQRPAPALIHQDLDVVERVLRDQLGSDFKTMWVDSESEYERILRFVERFQPKLLSRVKLYTRSKPIFDAFNITPELEKALRPKVWLKSGGYIVINQTEALVAIDVNTGKYVGKSDRLEDTIVKTNLEAVKEIVRQIRLRDLGGIIVVDFIDMDDRKNRHQVMQALDNELRLDRAPSKSLHFNEFGLVAITRKRVKQSLERTLCTPCPYCTGSGFVKSTDTVIFEILNEARKMAPRVRSRKDLTIRVNPEVARLLKSRDNSFLQEIEEIFRANVLVRGDVSLHREHFDIN